MMKPTTDYALFTTLTHKNQKTKKNKKRILDDRFFYCVYKIFRYYIMSLTRTGKAKRADARGDHKKAATLRRQQAFVDAHPVGEGCENCPEHCTAALCGDKCADKCYKKPDTKIYPSRDSDSGVNTGQPKYGGRKTRKKRRRKRRKTHKKRRKTKRKKRRRKKKKSRRRRK